MAVPRRKVDICGLIYRPRDPDNYGYICPACYARYGSTQASGVIDVVRCNKCPEFSFRHRDDCTGSKWRATVRASRLK